ncbi:MAG: winged helix-turn-helix transcriptional regulator [Thermoleophilaceae bacterium]
MLPRTYDEQVCSVARALEVVGDRWTMLLIRDAFRGKTRFHEFERSLGAPKKVLADRLERLVDEDVLERRRYQERPERYEYVLTKKGRGLWRVLAQLMFWGDEHYPAEGGSPQLLRHIGCGGRSDARFRCKKCGAELERHEVELVPGPGLKAARAA